MQTSPTKLHFPSLVQFLISALGLTTFLGIAPGMILLGMFTLLSGNLSSQEAISLFSLSWISIFACILMIPSLIYSGARLLNRKQPTWRIAKPYRFATKLLILWPLLLLAGYFISGNEIISPFLLPPLQVLTIAIPLLWLVESCKKGLPTISPQRNWGIVSFSATFTMALTLILEFVLIGIIGGLAVVWLSSQPGALEEINRLAQRLMYSQMNPAVIERIITPYLRKPAVLFGIISFTSVLIPIMEELIKPLAVWVSVRKRPSPSKGFIMGATCGAMFALFESLGMLLSSTSSEMWLVVILARLGTGILHITTSALVGWGLASAWSEGKYLRLGLNFLLGVFLHGLWNALSLLSGFGFIINTAAVESNTGFLSAPSQIMIVVLVLFAAIMLGFLIWQNKRFQKANLSNAQENTI